MGRQRPFEQSTSTRKPSRSRLPLLIFLLAILILAAHLDLPPLFGLLHSSSGLLVPHRWTPCDENSGFLCTFLDVPTDYTNVSFGTTTLAVAMFPSRFPRSSPKYKGAIYTNPGGPGGSGRSAVFGLAPSVATITRGQYDIIGHDPRGIGLTRPQTKCFKSDRAYQLFRANTRLEKMFDLPPDPFSVEGREVMVEQQREVIAMWGTEYKLCNEVLGDKLKFMGTTQAAKDIERMNDVFGEKGSLINFWGFSYGTVIGAYLVNIISPSKLGRVIIDGVASPPQWATQHKESFLYQALMDTEKTYQHWFLDGCFLAGPERCPLVLPSDKSGSDIATRIDSFLDELYLSPLAISNSTRPGVFTSGGLRSLIMSITTYPHGWSSFAATLAAALADPSPSNPAILSFYESQHRPILPASSPNSTSVWNPLARIAVSCADSIPYDAPRTAESMVDETLDLLANVTRRFGASVSLMEEDGGCWMWNATGGASDVFRGPFNATLNTPMLILSNTADPVTPLASGREMANLMGSSAVLLTQDAPGHCSSSSTSLCTARHIRAFFLDGVLPPPNSVCAIDDDFFPPNEESKFVASSFGESEEDQELWTASRELKEAWGGWRTSEGSLPLWS